MSKVKYIQDINKLKGLTQSERKSLLAVSEEYSFLANDYYLNLIDWNNPDDPLRKIVVPSLDELKPWGDLDACDEETNYMVPGLQHKYSDTALLMVTDICASFCRFCFRKRLFMSENDEVMNDIGPGIEYIKKHPSINNVLLTGGEPLLLSTGKLEKILKAIRDIHHIGIIRIGTKIPAFNPFRILDDSELPTLIERYSLPQKRIYVMIHFNHPREMTEHSLEALKILRDAGAVLCNQTPLLRGINDNPLVISKLMRKLSFMGVTPYYFFINRPTKGNRKFCLPITEAYKIFDKARSRLSGLSKRARLVMSHSTGKIEIVGLDNEKIYLRYHRARNPEDESKIMVFNRDNEAYWFDDFIARHKAIESNNIVIDTERAN